ncbi:MAG: hypothetical protein IIB95_12480 [Candidatus Marinimicrobia bacterium]|nr:hypothetical protein [Candidatus Neomarinimicrobiota bacterium]
MRWSGLIPLLFAVSCTLWEYEDPSAPYEKATPETFLSLVANDTIYAHVDSLTGEIIYAIDEEPTPGMVWDTLDFAFTTITTSKQQLHWWGEDTDGNVIGYKYKWSSDSVWTFTTEEEGLFYVPIRTDLDVFSFEVKAIDNDSLEDATPAKLTVPIRNSPPEIGFRYRSNPFVDDIHSDTSLTFPTRTFVWDVTDQDGIETITDIYYALDDTCGSCWTRLDAASYSSITLTDIAPGYHRFYLKVEDIAGAESDIVYFPDDTNPNEPGYWRVMPILGNVLLVDDFVQDSQNNAQKWYRSVLDSLLGETHYSVWEIGSKLPFSANDVSANLKYFNKIIWYAAYTGGETYHEASSSILTYILDGGHFFLNAPELKDSTFTWFPLKDAAVINPSGRLMSGTILESQIADSLDLVLSSLVAIRVKEFSPDSSQFSSIKSLYQLKEGEGNDEWTGSPNVCSLGRFQISPTEESGKVVLFSIPIHNGSVPVQDGIESFINYILFEEFAE